MKKKFFTIGLAAVVAGGSLTSCDEQTLETVLAVLDMILTDDGTTITTEDGRSLGWLGNEEDTERIEDDIQINPGKDSEVNGVTGLPSKVDLTAYLPKIGDQGQFGTCVAWATAYNARTWLYAKDKGIRGSSLRDDHICSPADMFQSIDAQNKGDKCQGTTFEWALSNLVTRGVASLAVAPNIKNYSDCACSTTPQADSDAANFKIKSYREINIKDVMSVKRYLAEGHIVLFGAKLGDNFMTANNSSVVYSNGTFNYTGIHAYHAIVCAGYDDNKGTGKNGAFRIANSWGTSWGDEGYTWVDCDFFCSGEFAYCGFVLYGLGEDDSEAYDAEIGVDLEAYKVTDTDYYEEGDPDSDDPTWRTLVYDVYNGGKDAVSASSTWGICYLLYNAYNANEYQIVLFDLYTDQIGGVRKGECNNNWSPAEAYSILGVNAQGFSISNVDIPGKTSVCEAVTGDDESYFSWSYKMPNVSGKYYLVLLADAFGGVAESNENNNYYFLTTADGQALTISNGVIQSPIGNNKALTIKTVKPKQNENLPHQTAVGKNAPNTYSPEEIATMIQKHRNNGEIGNKALNWQRDNQAKPRRICK